MARSRSFRRSRTSRSSRITQGHRYRGTQEERVKKLETQMLLLAHIYAVTGSEDSSLDRISQLEKNRNDATVNFLKGVDETLATAYATAYAAAQAEPLQPLYRTLG